MSVSLPILREPQLPLSLQVQVARTSPRSVRISVTDRCDMACVYCRPSRRDGYLPPEDRLNVDAWERLVRGLILAGVRRVRITGGEPLLFKHIVELVQRIAALGVEDLALTTNASRLASLARPLRQAGLRRVNISLDSLDPARFARITRGGRLNEVLQGIEAAIDANFEDIKLNTVVLRGINDDELVDITQWAWARGITPRFIEVMGVGEGAKIFRTHGVGYKEIRARLEHLLKETPAVADPDRGPAKYVPSRDGTHRVGFITGTTETFCDRCDRLRATSNGMLRPCLSRNDGVHVADLLQTQGNEAAIATRLAEAWAMKPSASWKGCTEPTAAEVSMRATGG